ncbi:hypothetical protein HPB50_005890 [Hyalomma asiaticum]|uniref:Uncharacterized protein n=1 Tax=Hyalomma asiaticum TaxID=266040 RepID=A0ACB7S4J2_HYAAI|nr:hypothetical protein HPB50_005890 [Hyalomma asiaticum]
MNQSVDSVDLSRRQRSGEVLGTRVGNPSSRSGPPSHALAEDSDSLWADEGGRTSSSARAPYERWRELREQPVKRVPSSGQASAGRGDGRASHSAGTRRAEPNELERRLYGKKRKKAAGRTSLADSVARELLNSSKSRGARGARATPLSSFPLRVVPAFVCSRLTLVATRGGLAPRLLPVDEIRFLHCFRWMSDATAASAKAQEAAAAVESL